MNNQKLEEYLKEISENNPVEYLSQFICPHLVGDDWYWIRKATLLLLVTKEGDSGIRSRLHALISGPAGTGKSIYGDSRIIIKDDDGIQIPQIKDLEDRVGYYALSINPFTLKTEWKQVYNFYKHKEKRKVIKITTRGKQEVIATQDHSFLKFDFDKNRLVPVKGCDLKKGELIPFISDLPVNKINGGYPFMLNNFGLVELEKKLHIDHRIIKKLLPFDKYNKVGNGGKTSRWEIPYEDIKKIYPKLKPKEIVFKFDYNLGFLTGFWLADGDLNNTALRFTNNNKKILLYIKKILKNLGVPRHISNYTGGTIYKSKNANCLRVCHPLLYKYLLDFVDYKKYNSKKGKGRRCSSIKIPSFCYNAKDDFIKGLICGYFTGDGTVEKGGISAITASSEFAYGINQLLRRLKIGSYVIEHKKKTGIYYQIKIPSYYSESFRDKVGFFGKKQDILNKKLEKKRFNSIVNLPFTRQFFKNVSNGKKLYSHNEQRKFMGLVENGYRKGYLTKETSKRFNELVRSPILQKLIESSVYWIPITKIEKITCTDYVYDLGVEDNENFVLSNGMVVHNTEFLLWVRRHLGGVFLNAELTSKVGLVGDARGKSIKPGLLADCDGNINCIDELDKMMPRDANGLLQAMEEGRYSIVKGRLREDFSAEVRVIGSANTLDKIQKPLLDRFDFILYVRPAARGIRADNVGKIVDSFIGHEENKYVKIIEEYLKWVGDYNTIISDDVVIKDMIGKYILRTRTKIDQVSYRSLELSILRIAYAMAKLERKNIGIEHVKDAIRLKDQMLRNLVGYYD